MRRWLCLAVVLCALSGCGLFTDDRVDAHDSDMTGVWVDSKTGATLEFQAPDKFSATDVVPFFKDCTTCLPPDLGSTKVTGSGTWRLDIATGAGMNAPHNFIRVTITLVDNTFVAKFVPSDREAVVERDSKGVLTIAIYHGDPDLKDRSVYYKK